ncbi:two-component system cell cycle sensor histidine kinase/response regulator CckA [Novosphingobium chloroacetimidivorans]|uniref:histidine kinase n=1 Tax=Novosphingobium chloroacetimidivorans TaxID=1428314 RepID=A0A7W7K797_9SPHN|nr:ATP-binding protein [Novosphingobium chloroacetimidivorans]MBB4856908.1 two-component system cell cycle sensor histidine kinase/response regulator CckA [Novosphingobium chloroacetimidivorans]
MSEAGAPARGPGELLIVALALVASVGIVWFATGDAIAVGVYAAGVLALGAVALALVRRRPAEVEQEFASPDWSVTVAAIERADAAIAVTDRAGRLVCANSRFEAWFGAGSAPPDLPLDDASREALAEAVRLAWRDGEAQLALASEGLSGAAIGARRWQAQAHRAGRGEDFIVWRFTPQIQGDPVSELVGHLDGKFGRALAGAGIVAALVDPDGQIRAVSAGFAERATGDATAEVIGQDFVLLLREEEGARIAWARDTQQSSPITLYHVPVVDPDLPGQPDPLTTPSLMLVVDAGLGIGASEGGGAAVPHLEALLGQLPLGLAMADRDGRLLFANAAFMRAAGREAQTPPTYPTDIVVKEDKRALSEAIRRFAQGPAAAGDIAVRLTTQPDDPVSLSLAGVRGLGDAAVLLGLTDSSEETRLKRQVAQATKMQAVGQLAGGVAHDFNNVLTAILGTCDLMLMRHTPGDSDYDDIQQIRANSNRAASLTRQLLAFSRQQTLRPEVLQLPDVVADISQMLRRLIGEKIQFVVTHDRDLGPVRADPTQLEQVIVNLAVNARDAMQSASGNRDGSGRLTLATRRVTAADVRAMRSEIIPVGEYTALVVEDTGSGIPPEHLGKIFEPFFTTKEQGKGTGLGLSTVYGIVKQSGGFIFADSEVGRGTRFTVYLPVDHASPGSARTLPKPSDAPKQWAGGGRILLVEDEDPVRVVAERALTRQGYEVTSARDGEEGLELVQQGGRFDLVVSDVVMPTMDGPAMARHIREIAPQLPVLFMSGYAEEQLRKEIGIANAWFMPKPFSVQQLSEKVGDVLAQTARPSAAPATA